MTARSHSRLRRNHKRRQRQLYWRWVARNGRESQPRDRKQTVAQRLAGEQ